MTPDDWAQRYEDLSASSRLPGNYSWEEWEALSYLERRAAHARQEAFDANLSRMKAGLT